MRASAGRAGCHSRRLVDRQRGEKWPGAAREERCEPSEPRCRYEVEESRRRHAGIGNIELLDGLSKVDPNRARPPLAAAGPDHDIRALAAALPSCALRPTRELGGLHSKKGRIAVHEEPVLIATEERRQRSEARAAPGGEIDDAARGVAPQRRAKTRREFLAPRRGIERFAQAQPFDGKPGRAHSSFTAAAHCRAAVGQSGNAVTASSACLPRRMRSSSSTSIRRSASRSALASPGGTSSDAAAGTVSGIAPAVVVDYGQAMRQRLGEDHPIAFVIGRQHEKIRGPIGTHSSSGGLSPARMILLPEPAFAIERRTAAASIRSRSKLPMQVSRQSNSRSPARASTSNRMALARRDRPYREQTQGPLTLPRAARRRLVGPRHRDLDAIRRNARGDHRPCRDGAGTHHSSQERPQRILDRRVMPCFLRIEPGFQ